MAGKCKRWAMAYNPITGRQQRRCISRSRSRSRGGLSGIGSLGQGSMRATLSSVKGILLTGGIAAGGAVVTMKVYEKIGGSLGLTGWKRDVAEIATGILLGILIAKALKKPKLAAAFAIGPVVAGGIKLFSRAVNGTSLSGLGLVTYDTGNPFSSMYGPFAGNQLGAAEAFTSIDQSQYPFTSRQTPPNSRIAAMPGL